MNDDYPTEEVLQEIRTWKVNSLDTYQEFMQHICDIWHWPDWGINQNGLKYTLHTGGWSGNEDIIAAMQDNAAFWSLYWMCSERGGHHTFKPHGIDD